VTHSISHAHCLSHAFCVRHAHSISHAHCLSDAFCGGDAECLVTSHAQCVSHVVGLSEGSHAFCPSHVSHALCLTPSNPKPFGLCPSVPLFLFEGLSEEGQIHIRPVSVSASVSV